MNYTHKAVFLLAMFTLANTVTYTIPAFEFVPLGDLSGGVFSSAATDVSGDGTIVVGNSYSANGSPEAFRWTRATGIVGLGDLDGGRFSSDALAISNDGSTIVGYGTVASSPFVLSLQAFRWTEQEGLMGLTEPGNPLSFRRAFGVSGDGAVIVGDPAIRWTTATGAVTLPDPPPGGWNGGFAADVSDDGTTIAGAVFTDSDSLAVIWRPDGTSETLLDDLVQPEQISAFANGISHDGSVIVGDLFDIGPGLGEGFRWTENEGAVLLGLPNGLNRDQFATEAAGISADGSTIVGSVIEITPDNYEALVWNQDVGWRYVEDILTSQGVDFTGWILRRAVAASSNGRVIVGEGINPDGNPEAWLAVIAVPEPSTQWLCVLLSMCAACARGVTRFSRQ